MTHLSHCYTVLAGVCLYLVSELSGSLWCLNWFGDSWLWSRGLFTASLQVTLVEFTSGDDRRLGARFNLTRNFIGRFFFAAYGLMILALMGFVALTWE